MIQRARRDGGRDPCPFPFVSQRGLRSFPVQPREQIGASGRQAQLYGDDLLAHEFRDAPDQLLYPCARS